MARGRRPEATVFETSSVAVALRAVVIALGPPMTGANAVLVDPRDTTVTRNVPLTHWTSMDAGSATDPGRLRDR